jgi:hypothetical protein
MHPEIYIPINVKIPLCGMAAYDSEKKRLIAENFILLSGKNKGRVMMILPSGINSLEIFAPYLIPNL